MRQGELIEANAILQRALVALLASAPATGASTGIDALRTAVGSLQTSALADIAMGNVGTAIIGCFAAATAAGASLATMERVRASCRAENPKFAPGRLMAAALVRFAIIQEVLIISQTVFVSRSDIDDVIDRLNPIFDDAELYAAENTDQAVYVAMVAMRASCIGDLVARQRPLPSMVNYTFATRIPALWLANRLYGDAGRAQQLVHENKVVNPAFMPQAGRCLSA